MPSDSSQFIVQGAERSFKKSKEEDLWGGGRNTAR